MRICRYQHQGKVKVGFFQDTNVVPIRAAGSAYQAATDRTLDLPGGDSLLDFLPHGQASDATRLLAAWIAEDATRVPTDARRPLSEVQLLMPIPRPNKLFLLAGNYASHIEEGGDMAPERIETFPYVFMKPPSTTLVDPGKPVRIPSISPQHVDWELELAVVIGRRAKGVAESQALDHVAGYTVVNDISDRKFRPNPRRKERPKDAFFDWLHGKWHDSFCPCGPCVTSVDAIADPQKLKLELRLNGKVQQDATTAQQIFSVAATIEFISSFVTLEPGDIISTGTPQGVGNSTGTYLRPGDRLEATISEIGTLISPVTAAK